MRPAQPTAVNPDLSPQRQCQTQPGREPNTEVTGAGGGIWEPGVPTVVTASTSPGALLKIQSPRPCPLSLFLGGVPGPKNMDYWEAPSLGFLTCPTLKQDRAPPSPAPAHSEMVARSRKRPGEREVSWEFRSNLPCELRDPGQVTAPL